MKWFWLAVLALVVATGALVLWPARPGAPDTLTVSEAPPAPSSPADRPAPETTPEESRLVHSPPITVLPAEEEPEPEPLAPAPPAERTPAPQPETIELAEAPAPVDPLKQLDELLGLAVDAEREESTPIAEALGAPATPTASAETPREEPEVIASEKFKEIVKARVRKTDDGFLLFDERFPVRGSGTADDPYEISWDHLVSASETYQPRQGKLRLPERITMLDGKQVRITGYVAFPIMAASNDEMLSMRNMWDGCCIGIPPTPYDAIEVRLAEAATGRDRFTSFGTIEGRFVVDPYVKGNWLLGLYMMEDATLSKVRETQTDPARHGM